MPRRPRGTVRWTVARWATDTIGRAGRAMDAYYLRASERADNRYHRRNR